MLPSKIDLLSSQDVAGHLGVSRARVGQLLRAGRISGAYKFGKQWVILGPQVNLRSVRRGRPQTNAHLRACGAGCKRFVGCACVCHD